MAEMPRLTKQTIAVLRALLATPATARWGRDIGREVGLSSGTLHPILARLEQAGILESNWEEPAAHEDQGRPRRRYYRFAPGGAQAAQSAIAEAAEPDSDSAATGPRPQPGY